MGKSKVVLLFHTVRYLRFIQVYYRLYYTLRTRVFPIKINQTLKRTPSQLNWSQDIPKPSSYCNRLFTFLNRGHKFESIGWNYADYGKLWTYNLNYFDFLNQKDMSKEDGLTLMLNYIECEGQLKDGLEPYPISLRLINWIKFISRHEIRDEKIDSILARHLSLLNKNLEYHLLGNHLLENAFALLFGAYYFEDETIYRRSKKLLESELNEQILNDGGHFELSPMYHQLLLTRLLDCINLVDNNRWKKDDLLKMMKKKAERMLGWLEEIPHQHGQIPLVNDSAYGIAASSKQIFAYANNLKLKTENLKLSDSGYRKWNFGDLQLFMDVGKIGPEYIPGHAHADTFSFELNFKNKPVIVDPGVSTYEKNSRRQLERSTELHNTLRIDGIDSSEVWDGFRVARRAKIISFKEEENKIVATHDGYKRIEALHTRSFSKLNKKLIIEDIVESKKSHQIESFLHFHPNCSITIKDSCIEVGSELKIKIIKAKKISLEDYDYALGFNKTTKAKKIRALVEKDSAIELILI